MDYPELPPIDTTANLATGPLTREHAVPAEGSARRCPHWVEDARRELTAPGRYLAYDDIGRHVIMPLSAAVTRIGRSVGAELRFEDTTVSRRHAVLTRDPDGGVRVLDDRSLNGVQVNGTRVESQTLHDGDEIRVGRHSLWFLDASQAESSSTPPLEPALVAPSPG